MAHLETFASATTKQRLNVSHRLTTIAAMMPNSVAVACPWQQSAQEHRCRRGKSGATYAEITFAELEKFVSDIATGIQAWGVPRGTRLALLVRPGIEFVALVFGLLRAGMVIVLVDPGLGRRNLVRCLAEVEPEGFVGIGRAQVARLLCRNKFPRARWNVTIGRRWFWGGKTLQQLRLADCVSRTGNVNRLPELRPGSDGAETADDPAAIIFTSGSTGPPKGVLYTHQMFETQVDEIQNMYGIEQGNIDMACFPLFALFNAAMGVTTVFSDMDFSRPANADPRKLIAAANDWNVTQAFASPAVWRVLSSQCANTGERIPTLSKVFSCGAPVPASVISKTLECVAADSEMHTPYGATECLPVSTIEATELLGETAAQTDLGHGVCVGRKFDSIDWRLIPISDEPITRLDRAEEPAAGEIGELIVRGPQVSREYIVPERANAIAKIADTNGIWHRTGDVGYFDPRGRFWYCGRLSQRVVTKQGTLFTECVEAIFNKDAKVGRCALVGVGTRGEQMPVLIVEPGQDWTDRDESRIRATANGHEPKIEHVFVVSWPLPVDVRHNAKINREKLAAWATRRLRASSSKAPSSRTLASS